MSRFDQGCIPPDFGVEYRHRRLQDPGHQRRRRAATATSGRPGAPLRHLGLHGLGGVQGWTPVFRNDRSYNFSTNSSWIKGGHEVRFGFDVVSWSSTTGSPSSATPAGRLQLQRRRDGPGRDGLSRPVQLLRPVPARPHHGRQQEPPVRADDRPRVAVRVLRPRPLAGQPQPDPQPGPALRELPAHDARGPGDRALRRHDQRGAPRRPGREPRGPGHRGPTTRSSCPASASPSASARTT